MRCRKYRVAYFRIHGIPQSSGRFQNFLICFHRVYDFDDLGIFLYSPTTYPVIEESMTSIYFKNFNENDVVRAAIFFNSNNY